VSRLVGQWLSERFGQPFVVESRTGAGGNIATEAVAAAPADGYTLLGCLTANSINASLYDNLDFDFIRDFAPVAGIARFPMVLLVNPAFPADTLAGFIAYAKANPGKLDIASPGVGTPMHVAIELLKMMAGIDVVHVPYRGPGGAFTDLLAGRVQAFIITLSTGLSFIRSGKLRPLAVTGATRAKILPDIPSVSEILPGFEAVSWDGICARRGTPDAVIAKLNQNITASLADPQIEARLADQGGEILAVTPAEFGKFIADDTAKWAKVVKFSGAKAN
jgi:tripartite-type tricarboxylate transporter receptor subunit TctC